MRPASQQRAHPLKPPRIAIRPCSDELTARRVSLDGAVNDGNTQEVARSLRPLASKKTQHLAPTTQAPSVPAKAPLERRKKRWAPKVTTGCITCRSRRLKCDEHKPTCSRCKTAGITCRGVSYTSSRDPLRHLVLEPVYHGRGQVYASSSTKEKQMFYVFYSHTVPQVSSSFDRTFWTVDVARASLSQPAIWHAILAMTAMHLKPDIYQGAPETRTYTDDDYVFAVTHYNKAVKYLIDMARKEDIDYTTREVLLMANILFTSTCVLGGDSKELMVHAQHGLQLFYDWKLWEDDKHTSGRQVSPLLTKASVVPLMNRLEGQYIRCGGPRHWHGTGKVRDGLDAPFTSSLEAYLDLQPLMSGFLALCQSGALYKHPVDCPRPLVDIRMLYRRAIDAWMVKYKHLQRYRQQKSEEPLVQEFTLKIWLISIKVLLLSGTEQVELGWDKYTTAFEDIVSCAESIATKTRRNDLHSPDIADLYSPSMCEALHFVADRCRNARIRKRAISLMKELPRKEGMWDSRLLVAMAEARMELEEAGPLLGAPLTEQCSCIPGVFICHGHRIVTTTIEFVQRRTASLGLKTIGHVILQLEGHVRILSW